MNHVIEALKNELRDSQEVKGDWQIPYRNLMRELFRQDCLFIALSKEDYKPDSKSSTPLISTKDFNGLPALYIFSDRSLASNWMAHYKHFTEDGSCGLIGTIRKENQFSSLFQLAQLMGAEKIMLDEGASFVGMDLKYFIEVNAIDKDSIGMPVDQKQVQDILNQNGQINLTLPLIAALPIAANQDQLPLEGQAKKEKSFFKKLFGK